ncbi:hypothetical protein ABE28_005070 [Peribacillus muralis]|uniref:Uncharacterized protein n=1 Tax=Peribacillus muralis TaxID=264697 RepID=A0A1B3XKL2_9BACI|nr:hypothetical protein ABE28_005070 [Peribacillus muralis]
MGQSLLKRLIIPYVGLQIIRSQFKCLIGIGILIDKKIPVKYDKMLTITIWTASFEYRNL